MEKKCTDHCKKEGGYWLPSRKVCGQPEMIILEYNICIYLYILMPFSKEVRSDYHGSLGESVCRYFAQPCVIRLGHSSNKPKKKKLVANDECCTRQVILHTQACMILPKYFSQLRDSISILILLLGVDQSSSCRKQLTRASRSCPCLGNRSTSGQFLILHILRA